MVNCVFIDENNYAEKLDCLLADDSLLNRITRAGYEHVLNNHTPEKRDVVRRWFEARRTGAPFDVASEQPSSPSSYALAIRQAIESLLDGRDIEDAKSALDAELFAFPRAQEPRFGIALYHIHKSEPSKAVRVLAKGFRLAMKWHVPQPDPASWGLYLLAHIANKDLAGAKLLASCFPDLRHPLLSTMRVRLSVPETDAPCASPTIMPEPSTADEGYQRLVDLLS